MKVCDLVKMLNLTVFCGEEGLDTEIGRASCRERV